MREIYDVIDRKYINLEYSFTEICNTLGINYTFISKMEKNKFISTKSRYILPKNISLIFTLVEWNSGQEYDCIDNKTISLHLNIPHDKKLQQKISLLRCKKVKFTKINDKVFYLKGYKPENLQRNRKSRIKTQNNLQRKISCRLRNRIYAAIKHQTVKKLSNSELLLGCSFSFFLGYITSKFSNGMSWETYGKYGWHIDHIIPCSSFDLSDPEQQKKCFHYTNLQPLWSTTEIAEDYGETNYIGNLNKSKYL